MNERDFTPRCSRCGQPYSSGPCAPGTVTTAAAPEAVTVIPLAPVATSTSATAPAVTIVRTLAAAPRIRPNRAQRRATRKIRPC